MKVFFDGGSRPEGMEIAVVIGGRSYVERGLAVGSSMDAEWLALLRAVELARSLARADVVLLGDAAAVIAQANGVARCPPPCKDHLNRLDDWRSRTGPLKIRYVKRQQNLAGICLARLRDGRSAGAAF